LGAKFRPDPCTNCTCQANSTTVCVRDNSRRLGGGVGSCPNVHPATITVAPPPAAARTGDDTTTEPSALPVVDSFQRQQEATSSSIPAGSGKAIGTAGVAAAMATPTALPASRPLTCAYRGVTYQVRAGVSFLIIIIIIIILLLMDGRWNLLGGWRVERGTDHPVVVVVGSR
jgi:hypothetical protein